MPSVKGTVTPNTLLDLDVREIDKERNQVI